MPCSLDEATHLLFLYLLPWNAREYSTSVKLLCVRVRKKQETIGGRERERQKQRGRRSTAYLWEKQLYPTQKGRKKRIIIHAFHAHHGIVFSQPVLSRN